MSVTRKALFMRRRFLSRGQPFNIPFVIAWAAILALTAGIGCSHSEYLSPLETRYGCLDLIHDDPSRDAWEQNRDQRRLQSEMTIEEKTHTVLTFDFGEPAGRPWRGFGKLEPPRIENGMLQTIVRGEPARLSCYLGRFDTSLANTAILEMRVEGGREAVLMWRGEGEPDFDPSSSRVFQLTADGEFHLYAVGLRPGSTAPLVPFRYAGTWRDQIDALLLELPVEAGRVEIRRIELSRTADRDFVLAEQVRCGVVDQAVLERSSRPILPAGNVTRMIFVPPRSMLNFHFGVMRCGWVGLPEGARTRFRIRFRDVGSPDEKPLTLFSRTLSPRARTPERQWVPVQLDLTGLAGRRGELLFESGPVRDDGIAWDEWQGAVWGSPKLITEKGSGGYPDRPSNLLLISLDTLRPDRMSSYGHRLSTTPQIDHRITRQGVLCSEARSPAPWTLPAHASLMSGLNPSSHGVEDEYHRIGPELPTLARSLKNAGYRTVAVTGGGNVAPEWGFDRGFDLYAVVKELPAAVKRATALLNEAGPEPMFLFFHTYETHASYFKREPFFSLFEDEPYSGRLRGGHKELQAINHQKTPLSDEDVAHLLTRYDSEIAFTDLAVGRLLSTLERIGLSGETLVVLLSDHGEEFNDHGGVEHGRTLYEELIRVPLMFRLPGVLPPDSRLAEPVSIVDIYPTILDLLDLPLPGDQLDGRSLVGRLSGVKSTESGGGHLYSGSVIHKYYGDRKYTMIRGRYKAILHPDTGVEEMYDLQVHPGESHDLTELVTIPEPARLLALELRERLDAAGADRLSGEVDGDRPLDAETLERLRNLGYLE